MRLNDAFFGVVLIALAIGMIWISSGFPEFPGQPYGAALFPTLLGAGFTISGVFLVVRGLGDLRGGNAVLALDPLLRKPRNTVSLLLVLGSVVAYILFAERIGFPIVAFLILLGLMLWFRTGLVRSLVYSALFTALTFWFFADMLRVPLPRGLLTGII